MNIDSLAGEEGLPQAEHLPSEGTTATIKAAFAALLGQLPQKQVSGLQAFFHTTTDSMLARDVASFNLVSDMLVEAVENSGRAAPAVPAPAGREEFRLLGDLPNPANISKIHAQADEPVTSAPEMMDDKLVKPKAEVEAQQYVLAEGDAPSKFRCSLNGHLMKQPVRSPYGHVFEKESIENWIDQTGSSCPFTGKPLTLQDLHADEKLMHEITSWHIRAQAETNEEDDLALYDF